MPAVTPLRYHGPGWRATTGTREYIVWAPNPDKGRDTWQSCWDDGDDEAVGDFTAGATADEVLAKFPAAIQAALLKEIAR